MTAMSRSERLWRIKSELKARRPYTCPHCGSGALCPVFEDVYRYPDDTPADAIRQRDRRGTSQCVACGREFCESN